MQYSEDLLKQAEVLAVERRPEACLGCGFEHNCSLHGCAVIRALIEMTEAEKDSGPLTLEELREMDGEPVWVEMLVGRRPSHWAIIHKEWANDGLFSDNREHCLVSFRKSGGYGIAWLAYRRKPEGDSK